MLFKWQTLLLSMLGAALLRLDPIGAQLFEQPATTTSMTNVVYTTYIQRATTSREPAATHIIKAAQLEEVMNSDALEPLLQQLLLQTMPNWQREQTQQSQQQQQTQQHIFVYKNSEPVQLASQQPQILAGFNGDNVRQQQQSPLQQPQSTSMRQQQQQFTQLPLPIQYQQQQQQHRPGEQQEYTQYLQITPKIALAPPATATTAAATTAAAAATWTPAVGFAAPIGTFANSFQPPSPQASNATDALCQRCCNPSEAPPATPCDCCNTKPLLSAALLKATAG